jgi:hypothetical protein
MRAEFGSLEICCDSVFEAGQPNQKKQTKPKIPAARSQLR